MNTDQFAEIGINVWLRAELAKLDTRGMKRPTLSIYGDDDGLFCGANSYDISDTFFCARGRTIAEAFAKLRAQIPVSPAGQLRAEAEKLLAQAAALEKTGGAP